MCLMFSKSWPITSEIYNFLILAVFISHLEGKLCKDGTHRENCERYHCDTEHGSQHSPTEYSLRPGRSVFSHPCRDWSNLFCNQTQTLLSLPPPITHNHPTICICRKFSDGGGNCHQFISRCFTKKDGRCSCCFNQPDEYCDHIKCSNGEPDFGGSNTTCVCHSNPADYPYHICDPSIRPPTTAAPVLDSQQHHPPLFSIAGVSVSSRGMCIFVLVALFLIAILTGMALVAGNLKQRKAREIRLRQRHAAHEALLQQKNDDERYLPSA